MADKKKSKSISNNKDLLKLTPPHSLAAEEGVLSCILIDKDSLLKIVDILKPEDFYDIKNGIIYNAMVTLLKNHSPIDLVTLISYLDSKDELSKAGGIDYITDIANLLPTSAHIVEYAKIVKQKSILRMLISVGQEIVALGYDQEKNVVDILNEAESALFRVSHSHLKNNFVHISKIIDNIYDVLANIREESKEGNFVRGVPSGFFSLDAKLSGFQKSDLIIVAARPSVGKTSFAINIALNAALHYKKNIGIFSLEMSKEQLVERMLCMLMQINSFKLRTGQITDEQMEKFALAMDLLNNTNLFFDDDTNCTILDLRMKARRLKMEHGLDMIIIDYIQLMSGDTKYQGNRVLEISEISRGLKSIAKELQIPVIALSQLSRAVENRADKEPQLSDLRDSGSIEQDADVVLMLHRDDYQDTTVENTNSILKVLIKKHRNGPTGKVELMFDRSQQRIYSIDNIHEDI